jgi:hypothetical protein
MSDTEKERMFAVVERLVLKIAQSYKLSNGETEEFLKFVHMKWLAKYGTG